MQAHQGNVSRRTVAEHADLAATVAISASKAIAAIDDELRIFHSMSFAGRLVWLATGRVRPRRSIRERGRAALDRVHRWADRMNGQDGRQATPAASGHTKPGRT